LIKDKEHFRRREGAAWSLVFLMHPWRKRSLKRKEKKSNQKRRKYERNIFVFSRRFDHARRSQRVRDIAKANGKEMAEKMAREEARVFFMRCKVAFLERHMGAARARMPPLSQHTAIVAAKL
jgi:hypothetical protein